MHKTKMATRITLIISLLIVGVTIAPPSTDAACWKCPPSNKCGKACQGESGKNQCNYQVYCASNGVCFYWDCKLSGAACTGTEDCGSSCHQNIEECGPANAGASLVIPNGEMPSGGSWLDRKGSELRLCRHSIGPTAGEETGAFGNPGSLLPAVEASSQSLSL